MISEEQRNKLFTSSVFDRKHGYIFLNKQCPNQMYCTTFSPEELYHRDHNIDDTIRKVVTKDINLWDIWKELLPIDTYTWCCFKFGGIQTCRQKFGDLKAIDIGLHTTHQGVRFYTKEIKNAKGRIKIEEAPVIWPLNYMNLYDVEEQLQEVVQWVDTAPRRETLILTRDKVLRSDLARISLRDTVFKTETTHIPYMNSFDGINLYGYGKAAKLDQVQLHVGQYGHIIRYYTTSDDEYATTLCALPVGWRFSEFNNTKEGENK